MTNFWKSLPKFFLVFAPMEDVTDTVFREIVSQIARPDVFFTEFTSADALFSPGREITIRKFTYTENQRPLVAQIWGTNPETLQKAAKLIQELKFDGVDINMGCPDKSVMKKGAGAALCNNLDLAAQIIAAVKEGAPEIPVSVKTRLGYNSIQTDKWIAHLLSQKIAALTIHGRIATQMSKGEANWDEIGQAVILKNKISPETKIIGNGDVKSFIQAKNLHEKYGVDGVMIGRGIFADPWIFDKSDKLRLHSKAEYLAILKSHLDLHNKTWGDTKNFELMKKFFKMYIKGFDGANELRQALMECKNSAQVENIILRADT